jgi:hypothetical protein
MEHLKERQQQQQQQQQQQSEFEVDDEIVLHNPTVFSSFNPRHYQSLLVVLAIIVISSSLITHFFPDPLGLRKSHFMD